MNFLKKHTLLVLLSGIVFLTGCSLSKMIKMAEDQNLTVTPSPVEVHADTVNFEVSVTLPLKMLKKKKIYAVETSYNYGGESESLGTIEFKASDFPNNKIEEPKLTQKFTFTYKDAMEKGEVVCIGKAMNEQKTKEKVTDPFPIAKGCITTSRLVKDAYYVAYADHGYNNKEELIPTYVEFFFDKGRSNLKSSEIRSERGKELDAYIAAKNATKTVTIIGSHSPEGLESINSKLSEDRAKVIKDFYFKQMKKYDYKEMADSIQFKTETIFQDWGPFNEALDATDKLTDDQKTEIRNTISSTSGTFFDKEKALQKLSSYKTLERDIYPPLRVSKTKIMTVKPKKSDAEISILAKLIVEGKASIDTLNQEELMYAATLTPVLDEKQAIYTQAIKKSDSWQSHNNLGAVYLALASKEADGNKRQTLLDKAKTECELANTKQESAEATNNLAVVHMLKNNREEALLGFIKAKSLGTSNAELNKGIHAGKGSMEIKFAKYDDAKQSLGTAGDVVPGAQFNKGLAHLLSKDYNNAKAEFANAINSDAKDALAHYCNAIASARLQQEDAMATSLQKACKIDSKLKAKAANDLEFLNYRDKDTFNNAIK